MLGVNPSLVFIILTILSLVSGYCERERSYSFGRCTFRLYCKHDVIGAQLPEDCRGSVNHPVSVNLTIENPLDRFDNHTNPEFMKAVTSLQAIAIWNESSLSFLNHMTQLRHLILTHNNITTIRDNPFFTLIHLERLDLSNNFLSDICSLLKFDNGQNNLLILNLSKNKIIKIQNDTFSDLSSLEILDLSHNLITNLTEESLNGLENLKYLRLDNNRMFDLNGAVNNLGKLKHLYLSGNQIEKIDEKSLKIINHLETFDASGNNLEKLKPFLFLRHWHHGFDDGSTNKIYKIILSDNHLKSLSNGTSRKISERFRRQSQNNVKVLTDVDLSNNFINKIEYSAFRSIMNMNYLDLSHNMLTIFSVDPKDLAYVKFLNLSSNLITNPGLHKSVSFSYMAYLENLDLSYNSLHHIPQNFFVNNYNLKTVNMSYNVIEALESLNIKMFCTDGGVLDLSHNKLSKISIFPEEAKRLKDLILNHNQLCNVSEINLMELNELMTLEMKNNSIESLDSLNLPRSLFILDLTYNKIVKITPSAFHKTPYLKSLYLGHNNITKIEYGAFQGLYNLDYLDLSFNKIQILDSKLFLDLKSLTKLSLISNGLNFLEYKAWLGHKYSLQVQVDENDFSCEWLAQALKDNNNGYSKMRPTVLQPQKAYLGNSIEGIPCKMKTENLIQGSTDYVTNTADERLLIINQKILEAVNDQNRYLMALIRKLK